MNIASIDIGTNTVLLLVVDYDHVTKKLKTLLNDYRMPRIGRGLISGEPITENSKNNLFQVLSDYKDIIEKHNCSIVLATATNALRIASNSAEIISKIKSDFKLDVKIISGEEEAKFAFLGSTYESVTDVPKLVIDIGGGSTELIYGKDDEIIYSKSFPFGAVSLTEKYFDQLNEVEDNISKIKSEIRKTITGFTDLLDKEFEAIAVAGTPTSLSCIMQNLKEYDDEKVEGSYLKINFIEKMIGEFSAKSSTEILNNFGSIVKGREDIILAGTIILSEICKIFNIDSVRVSSKGIRYGAVVNYLRTEYQNGK